MAKYATQSVGPSYLCKCNWPESCHVQCGSRGVVFSQTKSYTTAFFEAFPDSFIRGEGTTIEEAEAAAWTKFLKILSCPGHEFERRGYENGAGFCKHCNKFNGNAFEPTILCSTCQKPTYYATDIESKWYCEECFKKVPKEKKRNYFGEEE